MNEGKDLDPSPAPAEPREWIVMGINTDSGYWSVEGPPVGPNKIRVREVLPGAEAALNLADELADQVSRLTDPRRQGDLANHTDEWGYLLTLVLRYQQARDAQPGAAGHQGGTP